MLFEIKTLDLTISEKNQHGVLTYHMDLNDRLSQSSNLARIESLYVKTTDTSGSAIHIQDLGLSQGEFGAIT